MYNPQHVLALLRAAILLIESDHPDLRAVSGGTIGSRPAPDTGSTPPTVGSPLPAPGGLK
jgi:hypothetical protein